VAAFIRAIGAWLPSRVVTNDEIAAKVGKDASWIQEMSGISERRWADGAMTIAELAARAGEDCLTRAGVAAAEVGLLLVSSGSGERRFPGPAASAGQLLGLGQTPCIDLPVASAGSLFGMALAAQLAELYRHVLVIGAEKMSAVIDREPYDPATAILFGDGAGACLISADSGRLRIIDALLRSDGSFVDSLKLEHTGPLVMNGMSVIMQASRKIPSAITDLLARTGRSAADIHHFVMHQANQNLIVRVAKGIGVDPGEFYSNIHRYGNTSSASMLIAASECWAQADSLLFAAFGAGFHWGALLAEAA
jgi:3-oxoacyl-[acyl-carrier-protein] synthase-3